MSKQRNKIKSTKKLGSKKEKVELVKQELVLSARVNDNPPEVVAKTWGPLRRQGVINVLFKEMKRIVPRNLYANKLTIRQ